MESRGRHLAGATTALSPVRTWLPAARSCTQEETRAPEESTQPKPRVPQGQRGHHSQDALPSTFERRSPRTLYVQRGANALQGAGPRLQILSSHAESSASCLGSRVLPVVRAGRNATCLKRSGVYRLLSQRGTGTYEGNRSRRHLFTACTYSSNLRVARAASRCPEQRVETGLNVGWRSRRPRSLCSTWWRCPRCRALSLTSRLTTPHCSARLASLRPRS